jgi:hypothetical protein
MRNILMLLAVPSVFVWCNASYAVFNSGSTGADGAYNPTVNTVVTLPPSGVLNYTTINIPSGVTVTYQKNAANTPVFMLATGDVTINGTISVNATIGTSAAGQGGPGGFNGGYGVTSTDPAGRGLGPGGGYPGNSACGGGGGGGFGTVGTSVCSNGAGVGGSVYGNARLFPLIGGSGGGGYGYWGVGSTYVFFGGGGGGAILIASSGNIYVNGSITANGSVGGFSQGQVLNYSGAGSGGGIRLVANNIFGNGSISAIGGGGYNCGGAGRIRLEAYTNNNTIASNPAYSFSNTPGSVFPSAQPSLVITAIGGTNAPAAPTGSYTQPDITLPSGTTNAVVNITAYNIPTSTQVIVRTIPQYGSDSSINAAALSGTQQQSTTSATVTTLASTYTNVITAEATFTIVAMYYDGEEIDRVHVAATLGGKSETTYITKSGKRIRGELVAALTK